MILFLAKELVLNDISSNNAEFTAKMLVPARYPSIVNGNDYADNDN